MKSRINIKTAATKRFQLIGIVFLLVVAIVGLVDVVAPSAAHAQEYVPLAPIEGLTNELGEGAPSIAGLVENLFVFLISIAAVLSVLMIVIGGVQYMTSEAISSKEQAQERIKSAILGLLLALASWLVLATINPSILNLELGLSGPSGAYRLEWREEIIDPEREDIDFEERKLHERDPASLVESALQYCKGERQKIISGDGKLGLEYEDPSECRFSWGEGMCFWSDAGWHDAGGEYYCGNSYVSRDNDYDYLKWSNNEGWDTSVTGILRSCKHVRKEWERTGPAINVHKIGPNCWLGGEDTIAVSDDQEGDMDVKDDAASDSVAWLEIDAIKTHRISFKDFDGENAQEECEALEALYRERAGREVIRGGCRLIR